MCPDVAGTAVHPAVDVPGQVDAAADAGADLDVQEVVHRMRDTAVPLADGHDVHVVVHHRRAAVLAGEQLPHRITVPPRHDRRRHRHAVPEAHRPRHADTDRVEPVVRPVRPGLGEQLVDPVQDRLGPGPDVGALAVRRDRLQPPVGHLDIDGAGAQVDRREPQPGVQFHQRGASAAARGGHPGLRDQPRGDQSFHLGQQARPGQLEAVAELGAGHRAFIPEQAKHPMVGSVDDVHGHLRRTGTTVCDGRSQHRNGAVSCRSH
jgi:hypothetical protein